MLSVAAFALGVLFGAEKLRSGGIYLFTGSYLLALTLSAAFSIDPGKSAFKLLGITYLACLAVLAFNLATDLRAVRAMVIAWLAGAAAAAAYAVIVLLFFYVDRTSQIVTFGLSHYGTFPVGNYPRIQSTFANPNMFCHYLSISWMLLLAAAELKWISRIPSYLLTFLFAAAAAFTLSPGIGAIILGTGIWVVLRPAGRPGTFRKVIFAGCVAAAMMFVIATMVKVGPDFRATGEPSARILTWSSAAGTFLSDPLTGRGVGTSAADIRYGKQHLTDAHDLYLNVAGESGLPALIAILALAIWLQTRILRAFRMPGRRSLALAAGTAFFIAFFYQGITGSFEDARHLWVLIGICAAVSNPDFGGAEDV